MKMRYEKPMIEVIEFDAEDIIRTSGEAGLTTDVSGTSGSVANSSTDNYDTNYNLSAGGKIVLD